MVIFGVALLSICMLLGIFLGDLIGIAIGINSNVGGVGLAMLFLVLIVDYLKKHNKLSELAQSGIQFWSAMYIPIVVAMAANQNVAGALEGGPLAIVAGLTATIAAWALVPILSKSKKESGQVLKGNEKTNLIGGESNARNIK